jgi:hypothetical protein
MLAIIALVLLTVWGAGLVGAITVGGFVHVLLVAAVFLFAVCLIREAKSA